MAAVCGDSCHESTAPFWIIQSDSTQRYRISSRKYLGSVLCFKPHSKNFVFERLKQIFELDAILLSFRDSDFVRDAQLIPSQN